MATIFNRFVTSCLFVLTLCALAHHALANQTFVDSAGRSVSIPDHIDRVMAAGPPASTFLYALVPAKLVGWVKEPAAAALPFLLSSAAALPVQSRLTAKDGTINAAAILALKPDLIVDIGDVSPRYAETADKVQSQTGIPYILLDGHYAKTADSLRIVGKLLGVPDRGEELASYAEHVQAEVNAAIAKVPSNKRPVIYYGRGESGLETGRFGSINLEIFDVVGARNAAAELGSGGITQVSEGQVVQWKPDFIFAETETFYQQAQKETAFADLSALKSGRVFRAPVLPFGWIDSPPSVNRLLGVKWLLAVLYPDLASGDLGSDTRQFYKLFYGVDLTDEQAKDFLKSVVPAKSP